MTMMKSNTEEEYQYLLMRSQHDSKSNPPPRNHYPEVEEDQNDDDYDDALSFCDLSIYSDASADWSAEQQQLIDNFTETITSKSSLFSPQRVCSTDGDGCRRDCNGDELFEFFSDQVHRAVAEKPDIIVFCGRVLTDVNTTGGESSADHLKLVKAADSPRRSTTSKKNRRLLHWIIGNKIKSSLLDDNSATPPSLSDTKLPLVKKQGSVMATKLSSSGLRTASSSGFGIGRLPLSEMKLDEIKSRQGKRSPRTYLEMYEEEQRRSELERSTGATSGFVGLMRSFSSRVRRPF